MPSLVEPNIHPILVHFAFALTISGAVCLLASSFGAIGDRRHGLKLAGDWMLGLGVVSVVGAVAAGFQAYYSVDHDALSHAAMTTHRNWAVPSAVAVVAISFWRWKTRHGFPSRLLCAALLVLTISLTVTGWWGANLVFEHGVGVARIPDVDDHSHSNTGNHDHATPGHRDHAHAHNMATPHDHDAATSTAAHMTQTQNSVAPGQYPETPVLVVETFERALRSKDQITVLRLLEEDVIVAENGGVERSAAQYADHHMISDMAFTSAVDVTLKKRDVFGDESAATVISQSQIHGTFDGKTIHSAMMETIVLSRSENKWRIAHIHWSSSPLTGEHDH